MTDASTSGPSIEQSTPNLARLIIGGVCVLGMLATFLPWAKMPIVGSVTGTYGDFGYGWFTFIGFGVSLLLAMTPRPSMSLSVTSRALITMISAGCLWIGISRVTGLSRIRNDYDPGNSFDAALRGSISVGNGIWLLIAASIATIILCVALHDRRPTT